MLKAETITNLLIGFIGGVLLVDAILDIYSTIMIKKIVKDIVKSEVDKGVKEIEYEEK